MNTVRSRALRVLFTALVPVALLAPAAAFASPPVAENGAVQGAAVKVTANVTRVLVSARGETDGIVLSNGAVVRMPARAFNTGAAALKPGEALTIEGEKLSTKSGDVIHKALVQKAGVTVADGRALVKGQKREHTKVKLAEVTATGQVASLVATPRGKVDKLVLTDGTQVSVRGREDLASLVKVGDKVTVAGKGGTYTAGKSMFAKTITLPSGEVKTFSHGRHKAKDTTT